MGGEMPDAAAEGAAFPADDLGQGDGGQGDGGQDDGVDREGGDADSVAAALEAPDAPAPVRGGDAMSAEDVHGWCRSMGFGPDQAAAALGCGRKRVDEYGAAGSRIPRFVVLACRWIEARRGMKNLHSVIAARMKTPMPAQSFRVWCEGVGFDAAQPWAPATLLGVRTSKVKAWLEGRAEVPWTVRLACLRLTDQAGKRP